MNLNKAIKEKPSLRFLALLLIPAYFILHNYFLYQSQINFSSLLGYIVFWLTLPFIIYAAISWRFKNKILTSLVLTQAILIFFFSFGPVYSLLSTTVYFKWLTKISVIFILMLSAGSLIYFFSRKIVFEKSKLPQFFLLLFSSLIFFDAINFLFFDNRFSENKYDLVATYPVPELQASLKEKPDIYYLIFDELMQTDAVNAFLHYDNSGLDTALGTKGFFVARGSQSAYYATPFSIASAFQSSVFKTEKKKNIHLIDYIVAYNEVQQNQFIPYLINNGYEIKNYTHYKIFKDEKDEKYKDPVYNTGQIVTNQTFGSLMYYLVSMMLADKFANYFSVPTEFNPTKSAQQQLMSKFHQIKREVNIKQSTPRFVHAHFFAPHLPVFFDSTGKPLSVQEMDFYNTNSMSHVAYKMNLAYTRSLILKIVDDIQRATKGQAIIIIQSDHGYRGKKSLPVPIDFKFKNFTAIYFPDKNYQLLTDDFFLPNTFRVLLNKYSDNKVPMTPLELKEVSTDFIDD